MIYRKAPPQSSRLVLRIVTTTSVGTLAGVIACGGQSTPSPYELMGSTSGTSSGASSGYEVQGSVPDVSSGAVSSGYESTGAYSGVSSGYELNGTASGVSSG